MKIAVFFITNLLLAVLFAAGLAIAAEQKVPAVKSAVGKQAEVNPAKTAPEQKMEKAPAKAATEELLDINSAREEQLKKIPGIGDEVARKIIAGRPYAKKDQLKSRKIITPALYNRIKDRIIAKKIKVDNLAK